MLQIYTTNIHVCIHHTITCVYVGPCTKPIYICGYGYRCDQEKQTEIATISMDYKAISLTTEVPLCS